MSVKVLSLTFCIVVFSFSAGCALGPWVGDRAQLDRFRHDFSVANFRLQHNQLDEIKRVFGPGSDAEDINASTLKAYGRLVHENASQGTNRLRDRILSFEEILVFVGNDTFSVCLQKKSLPPLQVCDYSETPYLDRIQVDPPLSNLKSALDRVSGR